MRILIAEDEPYLRRLLGKLLTREGYAVDACQDGEEALSHLTGPEPYDAAVLDVMMPRMDGIAVLRAVRDAGLDIPVLLLTAKDAVSDRVAGLDSGADDYLTKPFATEELLARLRALIRRRPTQLSTFLHVGDLTLDPASRRVTRAGQLIALSAREYSILECLMRSAGAVLTRQQIEERIFSYDYQGASNVVDVYIRYLRGKIDAGHEKKLIHTVRGAGYVLREDP